MTDRQFDAFDAEALEKALLSPIPQATSKDKIVESSPTKGIGILDPRVTFLRKFRWTLQSERLSPCFVQNLKVDYIEKTLDFRYIEVSCTDRVGLHPMIWAKELKEKMFPDEKLVLTYYDGCGTVLDKVVFNNLELVGHKTDLDYTSSDVCYQNFIVKFQGYEFFLPEKEAVPVPKPNKPLARPRFTWTLAVEDSDLNVCLSERTVKLDQRPSLNIEEVELNYLNYQTWIPGRASWQELRLTVSGDLDNKPIDFEDKNRRYKIILKYYRDSDLLERWDLQDSWFSGVNHTRDGKCELSIIYSHVDYKPQAVHNETTV